MLIHRINHESAAIQSSEASEGDLDQVTVGDQGHTLLSLIIAGQPTFFDGYWVFGEKVMTVNGLQPSDQYQIVAGYQPHNGSNGNCDAHWIEVRQLVHRSACAIGRALTMNLSGAAGQLS
jgi:hypothetical protein